MTATAEGQINRPQKIAASRGVGPSTASFVREPEGSGLQFLGKQNLTHTRQFTLFSWPRLTHGRCRLGSLNIACPYPTGRLPVATPVMYHSKPQATRLTEGAKRCIVASWATAPGCSWWASQRPGPTVRHVWPTLREARPVGPRDATRPTKRNTVRRGRRRGQEDGRRCGLWGRDGSRAL